MEQGTQIAYVPMHANQDITHPDVQFGFVTSEGEYNHHFCRYWMKGKIGVELRTTANSELTPNSLLVEFASLEQAHIYSWLQQLNYVLPVAGEKR